MGKTSKRVRTDDSADHSTSPLLPIQFPEECSSNDLIGFINNSLELKSNE